MKKFLRITTLFHLLLLFGCFVGFNSGTVLKSNSVSVASHYAETEEQSTLNARNLLCPCNPIESLITGVSQVFPSFSKQPFFDFIAFFRSRERDLVTAFLHYRFYAGKLLLRFSTRDIIFPFHSFW